MCTYGNCPNPEDTPSRKCTSCGVSSYCGPECQKADWGKHKTWCRAVKDSRNCERCRQFPKSVTPLHADKNLSRLSWRDFARSLPDDFVPVYHAPFSPVALCVILAMSPPDASGPITAGLDTIFLKGENAYLGMWGEDFNQRSLRLIFTKTSESCCVCLQVPSQYQVSCGQCKESFCLDCMHKIKATGAARCPMCRNEGWV